MTAPTEDKMPELKPCPFHPSFQIGDVVEIGGEYAEDWRGTLHQVAEISWNKKKNRIEYGIYQVDTNDGMTTDWLEEHLVLVMRFHPQRADREELERVRKKIDNVHTLTINGYCSTFSSNELQETLTLLDKIMGKGE